MVYEIISNILYSSELKKINDITYQFCVQKLCYNPSHMPKAEYIDQHNQLVITAAIHERFCDNKVDKDGDTERPFVAASIAKPYLAAAMMRMHEEGSLAESLDRLFKLIMLHTNSSAFSSFNISPITCYNLFYFRINRKASSLYSYLSWVRYDTTY